MSVTEHTHTKVGGGFDQDVEELRDDDGIDYSGWWCVRTDPFSCPAAGCQFVASHMTAAHLIVVWPARDDRALLSAARDAREFDRNPRVEEYTPNAGACIPYDLWVRIGRPVHGRADKPDGWDERTMKRL